MNGTNDKNLTKAKDLHEEEKRAKTKDQKDNSENVQKFSIYDGKIMEILGCKLNPDEFILESSLVVQEQKQKLKTNKDKDDVEEEDNEASEEESEEEQEKDRKNSSNSTASPSYKKLLYKLGKPPNLLLSLNDGNILEIPSCLFEQKHLDHNSLLGEQEMLVFEEIQKQNSTIIVALLRNGHFAGGVYQKNKLINHATFHRYTIRKKQGKSQSNQDSKKTAHSMGAQLRRHGEQQLKSDIQHLFENTWNHFFSQSTSVYMFISCPKTQLHYLEFVKEEDYAEKIHRRSIPLPIGRPSFQAVCAVHELLTSVLVRPKSQLEIKKLKEKRLEKERNDQIYHVETCENPDFQVKKEISKHNKEIQNEVSTHKTTTQEKHLPNEEFPSYSAIHDAVQEGNLILLKEICEGSSDIDIEIDAQAGPLLSTALHLASTLNHTEIIQYLLIQCHANPNLIDTHSRVPYLLCTTQEARNAFRIARSTLGEDIWDWKKARVDSPLTTQDIQDKLEKSQQKKRLKRQKQKQKKKLEQQKLQQEVEQEQKEDTTNNLKSNHQLACDFCGTIVKNKSKLFYKGEYKYSSMDCLKKHQRDIMAKAALSRFKFF